MKKVRQVDATPKIKTRIAQYQFRATEPGNFQICIVNKLKNNNIPIVTFFQTLDVYRRTRLCMC